MWPAPIVKDFDVKSRSPQSDLEMLAGGCFAAFRIKVYARGGFDLYSHYYFQSTVNNTQYRNPLLIRQI